MDKPVDWLFPRGERKIMFIDLLTFIKLLIEKIRYTFCLLDLMSHPVRRGRQSGFCPDSNLGYILPAHLFA